MLKVVVNSDDYFHVDQHSQVGIAWHVWRNKDLGNAQIRSNDPIRSEQMQKKMQLLGQPKLESLACMVR